MTAPNDIDNFDNQDANAGRTKTGKGETDGSFGDGKAGAGAGLGAILSVSKDKAVRAERRAYVGNEAVDALIEFCQDTLVASANLAVSFVKTANAKAFAIVSWVAEFAKTHMRELALNRDQTATRDTRTHAQKKTPGFGMSLGPTGPTMGPTE